MRFLVKSIKHGAWGCKSNTCGTSRIEVAQVKPELLMFAEHGLSDNLKMVPDVLTFQSDNKNRAIFLTIKAQVQHKKGELSDCKNVWAVKVCENATCSNYVLSLPIVQTLMLQEHWEKIRLWHQTQYNNANLYFNILIMFIANIVQPSPTTTQKHLPVCSARTVTCFTCFRMWMSKTWGAHSKLDKLFAETSKTHLVLKELCSQEMAPSPISFVFCLKQFLEIVNVSPRGLAMTKNLAVWVFHCFVLRHQEEDPGETLQSALCWVILHVFLSRLDEFASATESRFKTCGACLTLAANTAPGRPGSLTQMILHSAQLAWDFQHTIKRHCPMINSRKAYVCASLKTVTSLKKEAGLLKFRFS